MNYKEKISIIVPVYNVEKYLGKCIESLINQTFKDIKIILVNDGSTDNSKNICYDYANKDNRIRVVDKKNGGLSDARNVGLKYANTKYVGFIDSDDYVDLDFFEKLYKGIREYDVEIATASINKVTNSGKVLFSCGYLQDGVVEKRIAMKSMLTSKGLSNSVCNKLFLRELFDVDPFPKGKLYEDEYVTYKIVDKTKRIFNCTSTHYYYRANEESITHKKFSEHELDRIYASLLRIDYLKKEDETLVDDAKRYLMYDCLTTLSKMQKYDSKYDDLIEKNIRENLMVYLKGNSFIGAKCFAILASCSPYIAVFFYRILKNRKRK